MEKNEIIADILNFLQDKLSFRRFRHTLGVAYTATSLAMCYDVNLWDAQIAGLLHDCAKYMDDEESLNFCKKNNIKISEVEKRNPFLLHGKIGSIIASEKFGIKDKHILNAIYYHTTGRPAMSVLDKIIFIADYIEPSRDAMPNLSAIRKEAFKDLDGALVVILKDTLDYLSNKGRETDPMTQKTYDYYCEKKETV